MFKNNIKDILVKNNVSQRELAKKIGITEASISRYVNGSRMPKVTTCIKIAEALGCEPNDLYTHISTEYDSIISELESVHASMIGTDVSSEYFKGLGEAIDLFIKKIQEKGKE